MYVDANVEWIDSEYITRTLFTLFGLFNPKCVNHPVESQQMGWEMMFPDYIIRKVYKLPDYVIRTASAQRQKPSVLAEPLF